MADGPYAQRPVFDPVIQSIAGFCAVQGGDGEPSLVLTGMCDEITSLHVAQSVCAALVARNATGRGQHVEVSMLDVALHFLWLESMWNHIYLDHVVEMPDFQSIYKLYRTSDGWAVVHGIATDAHWHGSARRWGSTSSGTTSGSPVSIAGWSTGTRCTGSSRRRPSS
jgi:crotonobetainyl-CoA:carnitine CoA-transferase CaiB-like acyl-CoA transferase